MSVPTGVNVVAPDYPGGSIVPASRRHSRLARRPDHEVDVEIGVTDALHEAQPEGRYISVPRAALMSPRSMTLSVAHPNSPRSAVVVTFAESSLP